MSPLNLNDLIAFSITVVAALVLLFSLLTRRKRKSTTKNNLPLTSILSAFQHESAETGKKLVFILGDGISDRSASISSALGLSVWQDSAKKSVFNDEQGRAVIGSGSLSAISQMILRGVYQDAVAIELFKSDQTILGGLTDAASVTGALPEVNSLTNAAVALIGNFSPLAGLVVEMAGSKRLPAVAAADTLNAQATFFVTTPLALLGENYYGAEFSLNRETEGSVQLRAQDWLRIVFIIALLAGALMKLTGVLP